MAAAQAYDNEKVAATYETLQQHRGIKRGELRSRLEDLKPHLDTAIDEVELELGLDVPTKAADRPYVHELPRGP